MKLFFHSTNPFAGNPPRPGGDRAKKGRGAERGEEEGVGKGKVRKPFPIPHSLPHPPPPPPPNSPRSFFALRFSAFLRPILPPYWPKPQSMGIPVSQSMGSPSSLLSSGVQCEPSLGGCGEHPSHYVCTLPVSSFSQSPPQFSNLRN